MAEWSRRLTSIRTYLKRTHVKQFGSKYFGKCLCEYMYALFCRAAFPYSFYFAAMEKKSDCIKTCEGRSGYEGKDSSPAVLFFL